MHKKYFTSVLLAFAALLAASPLYAQAQAEIAAIWNDPIFKKQFIGSYGINAELEPRVTKEEVKILETIRPLMAEDLPEAEETLKDEINNDSSAILDFTLGSIQFQQDKVDAALENYQKAVAKFPSFRRAWRNLGLINVRKGNYDEAIQSFTRMMELGGADGYAYGLLGFAYSSKRDYQAAEAAYRNALLLHPENTEWRLGLTRCVFKQEKFEDAAALLNVLIERFPDKADFWLLQAHTYLGMKQALKAAENLEALDRLGKSTADSLHTLGDIYFSENLMDLAVNAYLRAIAIDHKQTLARPMRAAKALEARGALDQARLVAKQIHSVWDAQMQEAERRELLKLEARLSMAEGVGNPETVSVLEEIVKLDPLDGEALMLLGQHYAKENQPDRAIFYYERAESMDAYAAAAKLRHAQVLVNLARYADAVPLLRSVQEAQPREDVARYLEQIERLARAKR